MAEVQVKKAKKRSAPEVTEEQMHKAEQLEDFLFGKEGALDEFGEEEAAPLSVEELLGSKTTAKSKVKTSSKPVAAWEDEADEEVVVEVASKSRSRKLRQSEKEKELTGPEYTERLRAVHKGLNPRTDWADLPAERKAKKRARREEDEESESEDDEDDDDADADGSTGDVDGLESAVRRAGDFVVKSQRLPSGELEASRLKDANLAEPCNAVVQSVNFHPNGQLMLTGSFDRTLRLFQVDGNRNPKVQGVFLEDMPIHQACFSGDGGHVVCSGRRKFFYQYDLQAGRVERISGIIGRDEKSIEKFVISPRGAPQSLVAFFGKEGHIPLVSLKSRQCIGTLKMNQEVRSAAFSDDGNQLITSGVGGLMYTWDIRTQRCLGRSVDDGSVTTTGLAASPDGRWVAAGSDSGVLNIYDRSTLITSTSKKPSAPGPLKTLMNLTTSLDALTFSPDSQILAMSSRLKKNALRMVHLPSNTVFSNWPTSNTPLHHVTCHAFSPNSGYFAIGNEKGKVLLYRLHHYSRI